MTDPSSSLARRLGLGDAVVIGLGSMIGAGVFASFAPAARAAGVGLLVGLGIAAVIAFCNAVASAQLAAQYPTSGGTYLYGRERLGPWWGFSAGWGFVVGKTASCAAMALTFAGYAVPGPEWLQRLVAVTAVLALAALNLGGITRTALLTRILVTITLTLLTILVVGIATGTHAASPLTHWGSPSLYGILQSAGLLFFAFAGYARVATLGEEVRDPQRTIPRAITTALGLTVVVYLVVALAALAALGPQRLAASSAPLVSASHAAGVDALAPLARVGAAVAALGALLALLTGIGRTVLAMARHRDLPSWLARIDRRHQVPAHAEIALAAVVAALVATVDLREVIGFSSFGVLVYYAIANAAASTQDRAHRRWPRALNLIGGVGCLVLVATLPWIDVVVGVAVFAIGLLGRLVALTRRARA